MSADMQPVYDKAREALRASRVDQCGPDPIGEEIKAVVDAVAPLLREQGAAEVRERVEALCVEAESNPHGLGTVWTASLRAALSASPSEDGCKCLPCPGQSEATHD